MNDVDKLDEARVRLVETGGRISQDLGLGRIVGQILVYLYLQPQACSLDELESKLGLSKASVSIAARQLEQLGLVQRVWLKGDRRKHYQTAENIGQALQQGVISLVRKKVVEFGDQLDITTSLLNEVDMAGNLDAKFLKQRISRANKLQKQMEGVLGNPLVRLLTRSQK